MKKVSLLSVLMIILLTACTTTAEIAPYDKLPDDYSLEDAKVDNCVVFEDLDITSGESLWKDFIKATKDGKTASVRLAFYYTIGEASQYSEEYYKQIKDSLLYIMDISYDGKKYKLHHTEEGKEYTYEYSYLVKYTGKPRSESATFSKYVYYVLVNDDSVTWEEIEDSMLSSQSDASIDHYTVYSDLIFD